MRNHRLRWALLCVAATCGTLLARSAGASHTVVIKPGDSVDSLARKYRVSVRDITRANGITSETLLRDGRKLIIPDPPKSVVRPITMRRSAYVRGDRIAVRRGPNENYRRVTLLDHGAPVLLTRKAGDWFQVKLPGGNMGWMRSDFLTAGGKERQVVASGEERRPVRTARRSSDDEDDRRVSRRRARTAKAEAGKSTGRRHRVARADREERTTRRRRHREDEERSVRRARRTRVASSKDRRSYRRTAYRHRARPEASTPNADSDVVRTAIAYRGVPYRYGGSSRNGFDCSGFTSYVYRRKGVSLPHNAAEQFGHGRRVSGDAMKPGDLVFFHTTRRGISHVGIYAGSGKFVHASSGGGRVRVDSLRSGYYRERFRGARRVK